MNDDRSEMGEAVVSDETSTTNRATFPPGEHEKIVEKMPLDLLRKSCVILHRRGNVGKLTVIPVLTVLLWI